MIFLGFLGVFCVVSLIVLIGVACFHEVGDGRWGS